jgi:excisionase family DNA binding protein
VEHDCLSRLPSPVADLGGSVLIDQAVQMLGVSRRTVYYWIRQGRLRTVRTRLGSQRVLLESIRELRLMPARSSPTGGQPGVLGEWSS